MSPSATTQQKQHARMALNRCRCLAIAALVLSFASPLLAQHRGPLGPHTAHGRPAAHAAGGTVGMQAHALGSGFELGALHHHMAHALSTLEFDDQQSATLQRIHERFTPRLEEFHRASAGLHEGLARAVHADSLDRAAVQATAAEFARHQEELFVATAEMLFELRAVLTAEQMARVHELHQLHEEHAADDGGWHHPQH